ncbi:hypothetical protein UG81_003848 [Salmonella enterica subsp. enterica serovar Java]|nr:hypothetical protein [Salmonella enterica subsp. enterica serovar Java]EDV3184464.1 hypothetical protein [Salmonella enterica subsp. diarizonae]EDX0151993.1 hypothetical protein [Salmonella enterica]EDX3987752.1 hypothetical protein [Salmonella enterica subsp. enterica serovar 4,[5],12:b:-]EDR7000630.1 hypothetical protein [Salmonella enterica subsp. enterica serovar Java]
MLRTCQSPPNPCGVRAIRLGSDGEGQRQACCDRSGHAAPGAPWPALLAPRR